ncbi:RNA 2',3'-cyclic phosphodiesterase [Alteromonas sp. C1M14]|uniref:RNA 2',3'-cyclic phosphodiesterase n=1 Tax=Alteromonas sp. C1M14 TaxID=2841567 RepID=UPI001C0A56CE|nr:RNA 2',3'-cyclic phosphodiesterase [Alteromonas sp. C1M14]MBU2978600.1 RNA 2',3'-cyclic phosphodiesterase [Alteromonas sp. C1M14]
MRCFIGLDLGPSTKLALCEWQQRAFPQVKNRKVSNDSLGSSFPYAIPAANYHLTLCFLGQLSPRQHESLIANLDAISHPPFSVTLNHAGFWQRPKILFAAPTETPSLLPELAKKIRKAARGAGIAMEKQEFKPHVTVARKATSELLPPLTLPEITVPFDAFHLFESVSTSSGVCYPIRQSWELQPDLSIRERLRQGIY